MPSYGTLLAQIEGVSWTAQCVRAGNGVRYGYIQLEGKDARRFFTIEVRAGGPLDQLGSTPLIPGPYPIGAQPSIYGGDSYAMIGDVCGPGTASCALWEAQPQFGSGTVTITAVSETGAAGTFEYVLLPVQASGATGTLHVTSGAFSVRF